MSASRPPAPARDTGLPPGVRVGPLGRRLAAYVVDSIVPAVGGLLVDLGVRGSGSGTSVPLVVLGVVLALAWALVCLQLLATRAATPGMRLLKLQLVGFFDGRPVGHGRVLLRWVVFTALGVTGLGLLLLLASVLVSPRHQGWHDRAASAVVIVERPLAPRASKATGSTSARPATAAGTADAARPAALQPAPVTAAVAGDPAVGPELAPLAAAPADQPSEPDSRSDEAATRRVRPANGGPRTILDGWVAELDDGRTFPVRGLVLLGRNPQPEDGEADAELVKLPDESRTVSKTHLALGVDDAGLFVVDRGSTNGSTVTPPDGETVPVGPFHAVSVGEGSVVSIGDHWVRIRREVD